MTITPAEQKKYGIDSINYGKLTWLYLERPSPAAVDYLGKHFNFHPLNLDDILSRTQRPKIDEYEDHVFMVLHFPVFDKKTQLTRPSEVDLFIGENYIITIHCSANLKPLGKFFKECQADKESRQKYMGRSSGFCLYHILDRLVNYCFPILNKITDNIDDIEEVMFDKLSPETVHQISLIRRDLISFRRVIRPQIQVLETLEIEDYSFFKEDQDLYFGDIADHIRKIWDSLEDNKEVIEVLAETSAWLTSNRMQEIMRILTIVMAIISPMTLVASIYGMNVPLPGGVSPGNLLPFGILLLVMAILGATILIKLKHRRWI